MKRCIRMGYLQRNCAIALLLWLSAACGLGSCSGRLLGQPDALHDGGQVGDGGEMEDGGVRPNGGPGPDGGPAGDGGLFCRPGVWQESGSRCILCNAQGTAWANPGMALDDGNGCTEDICDPAAGIRNPPGNEGGRCNDRNPLTPDDVCLQGVCVGTVDPDGDGIPNHGTGSPCNGPGLMTGCLDNCPAVANPDQKDSDNDGTGDACKSAALARWWARVETTAKVVALTFDDGWSDVNLASILNTLENKAAYATFFLNGLYMQDGTLDRDNLLRAHYSGHLLGNHTMNHTVGDTYNTVKAEVADCEEYYLNNGLGSLKPWYRSPGGTFFAEMPGALESLGFTESVLWSMEPMDWTDPEPLEDDMVRCLTDLTEHGDILLFHIGPDVTAGALPRIIDNLRARGFEFLTIEQLAGYGPKKADNRKSCLGYYQ